MEFHSGDTMGEGPVRCGGQICHEASSVSHTRIPTPAHTQLSSTPPQGNWPVFGMVVKLIKNVAKHDSAALLPGGGGGGGGGGIDGVGEVVKLLLGVARLVSRMPDQRKLLKVGQGCVGD